MQFALRASAVFFFALATAFVFQFAGTEAHAQSSYFTSKGCVNCHVSPVVATCNGCHHHGTHSSSSSGINIAGTTNKSSYAPGETVTVTMTGGYKSGWFRATLFDQDGVAELARSNGNDSGMGNSATYPAVLTAPAPSTPGTYIWIISWYGNATDASGAVFGPNWTLDPNNQNPGTANASHGWEKVALPSFTVVAAVPSAPTITNISPTSMVQGTTSSTLTINGTNLTGGTATVTATSISLPVSVSAGAATGAGTVTVTTAGGTASSSFTVTAVAGPAPVLTLSMLADGSHTNQATLNVSGTATDPAGIKSVTVNGTAVTVNPDGTFSTALALTIGSNTITVVATDTNNLQTTQTRTVTYDPNAPVLTVVTPADNSVTAQASVAVSGSVNESSTVAISVNDGSSQTATMNGFNYSANVNLAAGVNTITIVATDLAGNTSTVKRTVTYDSSSNPVVLAVTSPDRDITTSKSSLLLKGTVSDAGSKVKVKITMNGRTYTPMIRNGAFQQRFVFNLTAPERIAARRHPGSFSGHLFAITVTATDGAGHSSSVTRNVIYNPAYDGGNDD